ncbi:MAG: lipoprotein [Hydrogenovibrio crunogenus]|nr:lipoprotein [Hydrogenovibrio crunogenus]
MPYLSVATQKKYSAFIVALSIALITTSLTGCGKKGPLYLPEKPPEEAKVAPEPKQPPQETEQEQP